MNVVDQHGDGKSAIRTHIKQKNVKYFETVWDYVNTKNLGSNSNVVFPRPVRNVNKLSLSSSSNRIADRRCQCLHRLDQPVAA